MLGPSADDHTQEFHLLPCKIHHNGKANVSKYFIIEKDADNHQEFTTVLRGRGLIGKKLDIEGFKMALILKENQQARNWKIQTFASNTTVWAHDQIPSRLNTPALSASGFLKLSSIVHQPIK